MTKKEAPSTGAIIFFIIAAIAILIGASFLATHITVGILNFLFGWTAVIREAINSISVIMVIGYLTLFSITAYNIFERRNHNNKK